MAINIDDVLVGGRKFPLVAEATKIFLEVGFEYLERLVWKQPEGYIRISRRSSVLMQPPYPMYFYPDNILESILLFQKGKFDYSWVPEEVPEQSKINIDTFIQKKWYLSLWEMTNVLPTARLEQGIAAFPCELPARIIRLFSYVGEPVLDPFVGSGTTMLAAMDLDCNSIGLDINENMVPIIKEKLGLNGLEGLFPI